MNNTHRHTTAIHYIIEDAVEVASQWNGDDAGVLEDRASCAEDIIKKAEELRELIEEMENL